MKCNRLDLLEKYTFMNNNEYINSSGKLVKIRPLLDMTNKVYKVINKSIIFYSRRYDAKQLGKPIHFGYNLVWSTLIFVSI